MVKTEEIKKQGRALRMDNDYLFKSLFRSIEARDMVARVLSKITGLDEEVLRNADYISGEIPKKKEKEKNKTSDVVVKIDKNSRIIVEMNASYYPNLYRKNTSYAFANYIEHTPISSAKTNYPNIILVNIDSVKHFKTNKPVSIFEIRNDEGEIEVDSYKSYHLILDNAKNPKYNKDEDLYLFALFMEASDIDKLKSIANGNKHFEKAYWKVEEYMSDDDFLVYYDKEEMDKFEKEEMKRYGLELGIEQGLAEGRKKGHEQGLVEGHKKGHKEGVKTVITNMIDNGFKISEISKMINIKEEEINELLNK